MGEENNNLLENKILILYILQKANKPLSYQELLDLTVSTAEINYFYFQQFLSDLLEDKYIKINKSENASLYELTDDGKNTLELTLNLIPGITKLQVDSRFKENFDSIKNKFSISAETVFNSESNDFLVTCKIIENHKNIFKLETHVGSQEQAGIIINNWNTNAVDVYPQILELLSKKAD